MTSIQNAYGNDNAKVPNDNQKVIGNSHGASPHISSQIGCPAWFSARPHLPVRGTASPVSWGREETTVLCLLSSLEVELRAERQLPVPTGTAQLHPSESP